MQERLIGGGVAAAIFLPLLFIGGLPFQLLVGAMAMVAVSEMLRMKHLEIFSIEGILSMVAAFILAVPIDQYFISLPTNASVTGFAVISFLILAGTVLNSDHYSFDDAAYPIASAFYVGFGFQNLIAARLDSWEKVLFALFIIWATDIGAYLFGRQFGQNKLLPKVSPNKTIEGSVGGILSAIIVALIFGLINHGRLSPLITSSGCLSVRFSLVSLVNLVIWLNQLLNVTLALKTQAISFLDTVVFWTVAIAGSSFPNHATS